MNWYLQSGEDSDVILYSKVILSRNIKGIPFPSKCKEEDFKKVFDIMKDISLSIGYGLKFIAIKDMDLLTKKSLSENHIIDVEFGNNNKYSAVLINSEENICIVVNSKDHIQIKVFSAGLDLENALNLATEIDKKIEEYVAYCYDDNYGYLTTSPSNIGTGLKACLYLHLPALRLTKKIKQISNAINNLGVRMGSIYRDTEEQQFDFYKIVNNQTIGISEKDIIKGINIVAQKIAEQERKVRKNIGNEGIDLEDLVYRSYGILAYAKKIDERESNSLISLVKLGTDLGILTEVDDKKVMELLVNTRFANMQKKLGKKISMKEGSIERAKLIKQIINS